MSKPHNIWRSYFTELLHGAAQSNKQNPDVGRAMFLTSPTNFHTDYKQSGETEDAFLYRL